MIYVGGKNRIGKDIALKMKELIDKNTISGYIEPFCGSLGVMKHMVDYHDNLIASDSHCDLIAMWKGIKNGTFVPPKTVSEKYKNIFTVGFAAETNDIDDNTLYKLKEKKLDVIVGNIANHEKKLGFESDYNEVIVFSDTKKLKIKKDRKINVAIKIISFITNEYLKNISLVKKDVR